MREGRRGRGARGECRHHRWDPRFRGPLRWGWGPRFPWGPFHHKHDIPPTPDRPCCSPPPRSICKPTMVVCLQTKLVGRPLCHDESHGAVQGNGVGVVIGGISRGSQRPLEFQHDLAARLLEAARQLGGCRIVRGCRSRLGGWWYGLTVVSGWWAGNGFGAIVGRISRSSHWPLVFQHHLAAGLLEAARKLGVANRWRLQGSNGSRLRMVVRFVR